jgi:phosphoribosylglycinamide formyltransferase-1
MTALVEAMQMGRIAASPAVVISNVPGAPALDRAKKWGIPTEVFDHTVIKPRSAHEKAVEECLRRYDVDVICLAGYMRLLSPWLVGQFRGRIFNVHPALLPSFPGLNAQQQALEYGVRVSGCTVHFVDEQCDHGPIVLQAAVPVEDDDTAESLAARILEQEHRIYPEAVGLYFQGRLRMEGRRVRISPA